MATDPAPRRGQSGNPASMPKLVIGPDSLIIWNLLCCPVRVSCRHESAPASMIFGLVRIDLEPVAVAVLVHRHVPRRAVRGLRRAGLQPGVGADAGGAVPGAGAPPRAGRRQAHLRRVEHREAHVARPWRTLSSLPSRRPDDGRIRLAADVSKRRTPAPAARHVAPDQRRTSRHCRLAPPETKNLQVN
jgi:hypothetical protein